MRGFLIAIAVALGGLAGSSGAGAQSVDPDALYQERCARCHGGDAAEFGEDHLKLADEQVVGARSGKRLADLLGNHREMKLGDAETGALATHFGVMVNSEADQ